MSNYKYMNKKGLKAMRINALIWIAIITIAMVVFTIFNILKFHWLDNRSLIIAIISIIVILGILFVLVLPIFRYKNFRYAIEEDEVHVRRGIIFIETNIIPYFRIQNIDINEGFIMRKYQLATLTLSTAGGNSEIELIDKHEAQKLKRLIKQNKTRDTHDVINNDDTEDSIIRNYNESE